MTVGRDQATQLLDPGLPNIHVAEYIPQSLILPHCNAVISHGGYNTTMSALAQGLPLVIIPMGADQFASARRASALGCAMEIDPQQRNAATIRIGVRRVLEQPQYQSTARDLQREIIEMPGLDHAVDLLEQLARDRQPIPSQD